MGSLISGGPSAPSPQPVQTQTVSSTASNNTDVDTEDNEEESAAAARERSLLSRERGRFGTVSTSFRGLLAGAQDNQNQKKTLLGE